MGVLRERAHVDHPISAGIRGLKTFRVLDSACTEKSFGVKKQFRLLFPPFPSSIKLIKPIYLCNQNSNRNPVVSYDERIVQAAVDRLREEEGIVRIVHSVHNRAAKWRQVLDERPWSPTSWRFWACCCCGALRPQAS